MSLLQNLTASLQGSQQRRVNNRTQLMEMLATPVGTANGVTTAQQAVAAKNGGHYPGDGHKHSSGLDAKLHSSLQRLIADSGGKVKINSGYRDPKRQAELFAQAVKKYGSEAAARKWVAPPGKSKHNHGLAADLGFADAATRQWVHANAAKYGLHFPMAHEPWHIELIGSR